MRQSTTFLPAFAKATAGRQSRITHRSLATAPGSLNWKSRISRRILNEIWSSYFLDGALGAPLLYNLVVDLWGGNIKPLILKRVSEETAALG